MANEVNLSTDALKGIERAVCRGVIHAVCWVVLVAAIIAAIAYGVIIMIVDSNK